MTSQTASTAPQRDGGTPALHGQDIIIFGATGSLARLKLMPALYDLTYDNLMPPEGQIIGMARSPMSDEAFRELARQAIALHSRNEYDEDVWQSLARRLRFITLDQAGYNQLRRNLTQNERLVYLAIPPSAFGPTVRALAAQGLVEGTRLLIEKPFGRDLDSAVELDRELRSVLDESQIFRIDHYLGKETVQNILVFRFGNSVFERVWNRDAIDHIEITVAESDGIGQRGSFYEEVGAMRDIVQNHLLQILSVLTMEPPASFDAESIRDEKAKLLRAVMPLRPENVIRGQYTAGSIEGQAVKGYDEEAHIPPGLAGRDLRRGPHRDRELALGRRTDLPAHRQKTAVPRHRDRDRVQRRADLLLRRARRTST